MRTSSIRIMTSICAHPTSCRQNSSFQIRLKTFLSSAPLCLAFRRFAPSGIGSYQSLRLTFSHRTRINDFRFGFSRLAGQSVAGGTLTDQDVGIQRFSDPQERIIPQIQVLGAFQLGNSPSDEGKTASNNFYASDVLFLSRGKHDLRLGTEIYRDQFNHRSDFSAGAMTLLSFPDFLLGLPAGPVAAGGNGASFSNIFLSSVVAGIPAVGGRASTVHLFALDDWKVTRALMINLGRSSRGQWPTERSRGSRIEFLPSVLRSTSSRRVHRSNLIGFRSAR